MEWFIILALVVGVAIILLPVAYVWYLNVGGVYKAVREARKRKAAEENKVETVARQTASMPRIREVQVFRKEGEILSEVPQAKAEQRKTEGKQTRKS